MTGFRVIASVAALETEGAPIQEFPDFGAALPAAPDVGFVVAAPAPGLGDNAGAAAAGCVTSGGDSVLSAAPLVEQGALAAKADVEH